VYAIVVIVQISCGSTSKKPLTSGTANANDTITDSEQVKKVQKEENISFSCGELSQTLGVDRINWVNFNKRLSACLLEKGFHGDAAANAQLAALIRATESNALMIFGGGETNLRGEVVFEALLSKSQNYTPLNTFDDGEDSIYTSGTIANIYQLYYCRMIESIDGWEPYDYLERTVKYNEIPFFEYGEDGLFNPEYGIEVGERSYVAMSKAYKEGKIIFKKFGEKN